MKVYTKVTLDYITYRGLQDEAIRQCISLTDLGAQIIKDYISKKQEATPINKEMYDAWEQKTILSKEMNNEKEATPMPNTHYLVHLFFDHIGEYLPLNKIFKSYEDTQACMASRTEKYLISEHEN